MQNKSKLKSSKIAGRNYESSDYDRNDFLSSGLAQSHEQVSDTFVEGTIDGKIKRANEQTNDVSLKEL